MFHRYTTIMTSNGFFLPLQKKHRRVDKSAVEKKISKAHPLSIVCKITLEGV